MKAKKVCVSSQNVSIKKEYGLANNRFEVQDRVPVVTQVLEHWFARYKIVKKTPEAPNRVPHMVVAASPGKFFLS